ncbi:Transposase [Bacteroidales bacterium Barb6]|nr:Transposase [Bacteroidales bacterium Barb6]
MAKTAHTFESICKDITAKKFKPVYVLMGDEPYFMDQMEKKCFHKLSDTLLTGLFLFESWKKQALQLYLEGSGFRSIGSLLGVSNVSVLNWIRKYGKEVPELNLESKETETVEVGEMHSYTGSKKLLSDPDCR